MDPRMPLSRGDQSESTPAIAQTGRRRQGTEGSLKESDELRVKHGGSNQTFPDRPVLSSSWESVSEGEEKDLLSLRRDRRKVVDTTTPTLVDEEDEDALDEEIVSYEQEGQRQSKGDGARRTPGATMYSSTLDHRTAGLRRTPGASAMHRSAVRNPGAVTSATGDSTIQKFGWDISTPSASGRQSSDQDLLPPVNSMDSYASSTSSDSNRVINRPKASRPPRAPDSLTQDQREIANCNPTGDSLPEIPNVDPSRDSCSPQTMLLASNLFHLLLEDDDKPNQVLLAREQVFRRKLHNELSVQSPVQDLEEADQDETESWMKSFMFDKDGGSASRRPGRAPGKVRRSSGRRSRQGDMPKDGTEPTGHRTPRGAPTQQKPKAVRRTQGSSLDGKFSVGSFEEKSVPHTSDVSGDVTDIAGSRALNLGGAFGPPSRDATGKAFARDATLTQTPRNDGSSIHSSFQATLPPGPGESVVFGTGTHAPPPQQPVPQPHFMPQTPPERLSSHAASFHPGFLPAGYGLPHHDGPQNMAMVLHPMGGYVPDQQNLPSHVGQPIMLPDAQNSANMPAVWSSMMPYGPAVGQPDSGWPRGVVNHGYNYGMPGHAVVDARHQMTPSPLCAMWPDGEGGTTDIQHYHPRHLDSQGLVPGSLGHRTGSAASPVPPPAYGSLQPLGLDRPRVDQKDRKQNKKGQPKGQVKNTRKTVEGKQGALDKSKGKESAAAKKLAPGSPTKKKKQCGDLGSVRSDQMMNQELKPGEYAVRKDNPSEGKRAELVESPATRSAFKEFYREFRVRERSSLDEAEAYAFKIVKDVSFPEKVHWRIYLELADLAKRTNRFDEARKRYAKVCQLQPFASQGWLEFSKLEEECGEFQKCSDILYRGLEQCELSENLLTRAIKHEEKMGKAENIIRARHLLARLKHAGIEKVWRIVLEGAMMEARVGRSMMARKVLKVLMHHVPWYGPLYLEAYRLERDLGNYSAALVIIGRGLAAIPRYGPLWFGAFRICEMLDAASGALSLPKTTAMFARASTNISRELTWKVHLEAAQIYERNSIQVGVSSPDDRIVLAENLKVCRERFAMTVVNCPPNLSWKVWLASGRMELSAGNPDKARFLFLRAADVVPEKGKVAALLECARLEEYIGKVDLARALLCQGRGETTSDWKVWLESVLLEVRSGNYHRAIDFAKRALAMHNGTGRLWAALIQLRHYDGGEDAQYAALKRALQAVPKSGEVWCEAGRIHMNPFSKTFDLDLASLHLFFATRFTPQYGDSFLEAVKRELLEVWMTQVARGLWKELYRSYRDRIIGCRAQNEDSDRIVSDIVRRTFGLVRRALKRGNVAYSDKTSDVSDETILKFLQDSLSREACDNLVDISLLELRCINADPNYGPLWFHCREGPIDTARTVLASGRRIFTNELIAYADIFISAIIRRFAVIVALNHEHQSGPDAEFESDDRDAPEVNARDGWEPLVEARLLSAPSLQAILTARDGSDEWDMVLLESSVSGSDFVTGLVELNKHVPLKGMPPLQRRKTIFGSDALFS